jgi:protein-disulfide isomerase
MNDSTLTPRVSTRDHIEGNEHALVTLVEYANYQCPDCGAAHPVIKRLQKSLGRMPRLAFRNIPPGAGPSVRPVVGTNPPLFIT